MNREEELNLLIEQQKTKCDNCKRNFTLEVLKLLFAPRNLITIAVVLLTIVQMITGG